MKMLACALCPPLRNWLRFVLFMMTLAPWCPLSFAADADSSPNNRLMFFVFGDPQLHEPFLHDIVARMKAEDPAFVLIPGDCCMANGADPRPWDEFFTIFAPLYDRPNTKLYAIPGNHDVDGDYGAALQQWVDRWDLPGHELYYSFNRGPLFVAGLFVTNGALFRSPTQRAPLNWPVPVVDDDRNQIQWLREGLKKVPDSARWKLIFHHEPGTRYSSLSHPFDGPGSAGISGYVEPMAFDANVDLIIRGHQHFYERTYPINIRDGRRDDARGVTMITTGGGCTAFRPEFSEDAKPMWFDAVIATHRIHYCRVTIEGNQLTWEAIDLAGKVFDQFQITKHPDGRREWTGLPAEGKLLPRLDNGK